MRNILLIGVGGFIGAILRYAVSHYVQHWSGSTHFPYGTLVVNLSGCLIIGVLSYTAEAHHAFTPQTRLFVFVGILGAFTTFSAFGNETTDLLRHGQDILAIVNIGTHMALGLIMVWVGRLVALRFWS